VAKLFAKPGRHVYQVLHRGIGRPDIAHRMVPIRSEDMEKTVVEDIMSRTRNFDKEARTLFFCWSHDECDRIARGLG
jgi:hypothetical protein